MNAKIDLIFLNSKLFLSKMLLLFNERNLKDNLSTDNVLLDKISTLIFHENKEFHKSITMDGIDFLKV